MAVHNSASTGRLATLDPAPLGDRPAAAFICAEAAPGDVIIYTALSRASISYYLERFGCAKSVTQVSFPGEIERHMGWLDFSRKYGAELEVIREAEAIVDRIDTSAVRIFVLLQPAASLSRPIIDALERRFWREGSQPFMSCGMCFRELRAYRGGEPSREK